MSWYKCICGNTLLTEKSTLIKNRDLCLPNKGCGVVTDPIEIWRLDLAKREAIERQKKRLKYWQ
jgi:hypothetical protein